MKLYVVFYKGNFIVNREATFFDMLVCLATLGKYSHVEIGTEYDEVNNVLNCISASPRERCVRSRFIKLKPSSWDLYEYIGPLPTHMTELTETEYDAWFADKLGLKYDWTGAIGTKFRFLKQRITKYFCSELVAEFFEISKPYRKTPKSLFKILRPHLKPVKI